MQPLLNGFVLVLLLFDFGVTDFSHAGIVAIALGTFSLKIKSLDINLVLLNLIDFGLFGLPFGAISLFLVADVGKLLLELLDFLLIAFALDSLALDFELGDFAHHLVEHLREGVDFEP